MLLFKHQINNQMIKKTKFLKEIFLGLTIFSVATILMISFKVDDQTTVAQSGNPSLTGWAWSDNIGWICFGRQECPSAEVEIGPNGLLSGFGWSDNIGWIKFHGLSGFPIGSGTDSNSATYDSVTKSFGGWARACAGTVGGDCSSMTSRSDGWDG